MSVTKAAVRTVMSSIGPLVRRRLDRLTAPLSRPETFIGLATGIVSVLGVLLGVPDFFKTPPADKGQLVAVVEDAKTQKRLSGATVEILTGKNAILNTLTTNWFGRASHHLEEG